MLDWRLRQRAANRRSYTASRRVLADPGQQALVNRLRAEIDELTDEGRSSSGSPLWNLARRRLVDHIRNDDPRRFLRWPEIRATMFVANAHYSSVELAALTRHRAWLERWKPILVEDPSGCPTPSRLAPDTSDNLIHHVYHLLTLEENLGQLHDFRGIVEFGGGYGSFARIVRRLGVNFPYYISDLPEFAALQRYYLASVALQRGEPSVSEGVLWASSPADLSADATGLFVALWSLSEVPLHEREPWCEVIAGCEGVFIAFGRRFEGVDNMPWFDALRRRGDFRDFRWSCREIPHLRDSFYLAGRRE